MVELVLIKVDIKDIEEPNQGWNICQGMISRTLKNRIIDE